VRVYLQREFFSKLKTNLNKYEMKKITLVMFFVTSFFAFSFAQNLVTNPGYEADATTFTVVESTTNVLMRVAGLTDATTQTANPTATAISVPAGMWVKKAANSGYIKGVLTTSDFHSGTNCMNLKITPNTTQTGLTSWYNCANLQKLTAGLTHTKKYIASVWAKVDATANNQCMQMVLFVTDNTLKLNYTKTITLTGGTTWTQYQTTFDMPTWITNNPTADFSTAFFGLGITTTYDIAAKTLYSGILLDDFSLTEDTSTGIEGAKQTINIKAVNGNILINGMETNQPINIFDIAGRKVFSANATADEISIPLHKGLYIVNINNSNTKIAVN
jgi:hypothetical protein